MQHNETFNKVMTDPKVYKNKTISLQHETLGLQYDAVPGSQKLPGQTTSVVGFVQMQQQSCTSYVRCSLGT
jgi:hypothetical protein